MVTLPSTDAGSGQGSSAVALCESTVSAAEGIVKALGDAGIEVVLGIVAGHTTPSTEVGHD